MIHTTMARPARRKLSLPFGIRGGVQPASAHYSTASLTPIQLREIVATMID